MGLIDELPAPPQGREGWPWTIESSLLPEFMPDGSAWPRIGIITPSYNQGDFLEETIRSVILQNYPNLEYIIIDGGSSDVSVDIIRKYDRWIDFWVSEKDEGQSDAINRGMQKSSAVIVNWINSDDLLLENALARVAAAVKEFPQSIVWVGACQYIRQAGEVYRVGAPLVGGKEQFANWGGPDSTPGVNAWVGQPSCFFLRQAFLDVGGLNSALYFTMDVELWMKLSEQGQFTVLPDALSCARVYPGIKTLEDYPGRMAEHVVINWLSGQRGLSRAKMVQFGERFGRNYVLSMGVRDFSFLLLTWLYRHLIKNPFARLLGKSGS